MKWLRPKSTEKPTLLLVSDAELSMLITAVDEQRVNHTTGGYKAQMTPTWKKLKAELETARKAL